MQPGFFDQEDRLAKLEKLGDPLPLLYSIVDWQAFPPTVEGDSSEAAEEQRRAQTA